MRPESPARREAHTRRRIPPPVLVPVLLLVGFQLHLVMWGCHARGGDDFGKLYDGYAQGDIYAPTARAPRVRVGGEVITFLNLNPPHVSLLVAPLVSLPLTTALRLWMIGQLACAVLICLLTARRG